MRIARKSADPWAGIDWRWEIPQDADPYDLVLAKVRIVSDRMPEKYKRCLHMLADGCSPNLINQWLGLGEDVIRRIRQINPVAIAKVKENILDNLLEASQVMSERLAREAHTLPTHRLANALAATIDKAQLLSGGVTQRTETKRAVTQEELQALFEALPRAEAKVIEDKENAD